MGTPLYVTSCFSLAAFKLLSLSLKFVILIMMFVGVDFFEFIVIEILCPFQNCVAFSLLPIFLLVCFVCVCVCVCVFSFLSPPLSLFPTGETTKPGVLKRLELDLSLIHI